MTQFKDKASKHSDNINAGLYTYPVLMDEEGALFEAYQIYSYPTTFMIDRDGNVFGYVSGMLTEEMMNSIIRQTLDGKMN